MLKIGKVYLYNQKTHYYVSDKKRFKNRLTYTLNKVLPGGSLGPAVRKKFSKGMFKLASNVKISIHVELPKIDKQKVLYEALIDRTLLLLEDYNETGSKGTRNRIALNAFCSCGLIKTEKDGTRNYNLRDFAKSLGFKSYIKLYRWVEKYLVSQYNVVNGKITIPDASDMTIISTVKNYQRLWSSYHGFNKHLDKIFETDLKAYTQELRDRGLKIHK